MKHWVVILFTCFGSTSSSKTLNKKKKNKKKKNLYFFLVLAFFVQVLTQKKNRLVLSFVSFFSLDFTL